MDMRIDIKIYGAIGDGISNNTGIIQECINRCSQLGGGTVVIDDGQYLAGTIFLKNNVFLEITESAMLIASPNIEDYSQNTHHNRYRNEKDMDYCFIYAEDQTNIGIKGKGKILGNAESFPNEGSICRPMMIRLLRCQNVHIEDIRLYDAAAWTTAFLDSSYIWVKNVWIKNDKRYNGDGLDFDGCSHVFVEGCSITGTDDNLCLQSSSQKYPVEEIHISNCEFSSICAAIRIGLKSIGTIKNVVISNCTMKNVWREGIKIECTEGGNISDILVNNVVMNNVRRPIFTILNNRFEEKGLGSSVELEKMPNIGKMENLIFSNIIVTDDEEMRNIHYRFNQDVMGEPRFNGIRFDAEKMHKIENVSLQNIKYKTIGGVKQSEIPDTYPEVLDMIYHTGEETVENYYPDWSRATYLDLRNIDGLYISNMQLETMKKDERIPYIIENCNVLKQEIFDKGIKCKE